MYPSHRIVGNPDLQPAYTHSTELSTFSTLPKMRLSLSASYMRTNNDVASTYYYNNDLFYTTYSNVGLTQKYIFNVNLDYHSTPWKVYRPILGLRMSKDIYDSPDTQGNNVHSSYFNYNLSLRNIFTLKNKFYIFFDATYYPVTYYYASKKEDLVDLALYFRKTFGNNFTAMICIYNLLNQNPVSHIYGNGYTAVQSINNHSRSVYLGFMYKFGKPIKTRAKVNLNLNSIETK